MIEAASGVSGPLRWSMINRALDGEPVSGDAHVVRSETAVTWLGVIDGLGHGPQAAAAAAEAVRVIESGTFADVVGALRACHAALARTRGAVMSIASITDDELTWVGVGNVEAIVVRGPSSSAARARLLLDGGVVGHSLPVLRASATRLWRGDLLVLVTDGLRVDALDHVDALASPRAVVDGLMARSRTGRDDALALAARYDGARS